MIFRREVLDQIRDRRTLFMIFVFPILLYPILGFGVLKVAAAMEKKPQAGGGRGGRAPAQGPAAAERRGQRLRPRPLRFARRRPALLLVQRERGDGPWGEPRGPRAGHPRRPGRGRHGHPGRPAAAVPREERRRDPDPLPERRRAQPDHLPPAPGSPRPLEARDRRRADRKQDKLPEGYTQPIQVKGVDVATEQEVGGSVWSRIFPFLLVMMSLTGAFYPAIDLCAGEKERGTMETLLISPATRAEIVLGKFLTVMLASVMTAVLNLVSMGLTGIVMAQRGGASAMEPDQHGPRRRGSRRRRCSRPSG